MQLVTIGMFSVNPFIHCVFTHQIFQRLPRKEVGKPYFCQPGTLAPCFAIQTPINKIKEATDVLEHYVIHQYVKRAKNTQCEIQNDRRLKLFLKRSIQDAFNKYRNNN